VPEWCDAATGEPGDAESYGVSAAELRRWNPLSAFEIHLARRAGIDAAALAWVELGATVTEAARAERAGVTPSAVREWLAEGFCVQDAVEAHIDGLSVQAARDWRAAGFVLPDALLLLRDGWALAGAAADRDVDTARNNA
jgi:hypothetical protein